MQSGYTGGAPGLTVGGAGEGAGAGDGGGDGPPLGQAAATQAASTGMVTWLVAKDTVMPEASVALRTTCVWPVTADAIRGTVAMAVKI